MSKRPWIFQSNPFETHTRNSNRKMFTISTDTRSKLQAEIADPDIANMFNDLDPVFQAYLLIYTNYSVVFGERKGKTLNLVNQLKQVQAVHLPKWEVLVHVVYPKGSPQEVEIFPNGRAPFLQGTYEERINAVHALHEKVSADAALAAVTPLVLSVYNILIAARDTQQQKEGLKGQLSASRESQRVLLADELFRVLSGVMQKFYKNRVQISHYFDLELLRKTGALEVIATYEGTLNAASFDTLPALTEDAAVLRLTIISGGPGAAGLGVVNNVFNGNTMALGGPGTIENPIEYFESTGNLIILQNQNASLPCQYKVEILG